MDLLKYVVRKCVRRDDYTNWMALYVDGKKVEESYSFDTDRVLDAYGKEIRYLLDIIVEDDSEIIYEDLEKIFPKQEDFSYLLDNNDIEIGSFVFLKDGVNIVTEIWEDYRESGEYEIQHWEWINGELINSVYKLHYEAHTVQKFKVMDDEKEYIWEDLNYHQSYIYHYLKNKGKI